MLWLDAVYLRRWLGLAVLTALFAAGCAPQINPGVPAAPLPVEVSRDRDLAMRVPAEVSADGLLDIGTDPSYRPMEYFRTDGLLEGVDIQLAQAVAAKLGLTAAFTLEAFSALESGVRAGRFEMGIAALSVEPGDTLATDAVLYLDTGTQLARRVGSDVTLAALCGRTISALEGSVQVAQVTAQSQHCIVAGSPGVAVVAGQTIVEVVNAVLVGGAEAMVGDSPVVQSAATSYPGELELTDEVFSPASLAILTDPSFPALGEVVAAAMDSLIADGTYDAILHAFGITSGGVAQAVLLPASQPPATPEPPVPGVGQPADDGPASSK